MSILAAVCFLTLYLLVWFKTDAFVEYASLTKLSKYFKIEEYLGLKLGISYLEYLLEYYNCFFVRLITCPICLSIWLGFFLIPVVGILAYPIVTVFGLSLYLLVSKLL